MDLICLFGLGGRGGGARRGSSIGWRSTVIGSTVGGIPWDLRKGDLDGQFTRLDDLLVDRVEGLLLVLLAVELHKAKPFAALVLLADDVGRLDVQSFENLRQAFVVDTEGKVRHEQSIS